MQQTGRELFESHLTDNDNNTERYLCLLFLYLFTYLNNINHYLKQPATFFRSILTLSIYVQINNKRTTHETNLLHYCTRCLQKTFCFVTAYYFRQILTDFRNSVTCTFCIQFAKTWLLSIPTHLKSVAPLTCEIKIFKHHCDHNKHICKNYILKQFLTTFYMKNTFSFKYISDVCTQKQTIYHCT